MMVVEPSTEAPARALVRRFSLWSRITHAVLALSVFGLILTGMPLKYSSAAWAWPLMRLWGGPRAAGLIHRGFATLFFLAAAMHLGGLAAAAARRRLPPIFGPDSIVPRLEDGRQMAQYIRYLRGKGPLPSFGKFTYWEKFDYFGEFWGLLIIGLSGLVMWFPEAAARFLPGWAVNASLIFHSYEALLATGFLFAIHFVNTHLRPEVFPLDPVIFSGRVALGDVRHERPGWYARLTASGEAGTEPDRPVPRAIRVTGIGFLALGTVTLLLVMSAALQQVVGYIVSLLSG